MSRQSQLDTTKQLLRELTVIVAMQRDGLQHAAEQRDKLQSRLVRAVHSAVISSAITHLQDKAVGDSVSKDEHIHRLQRKVLSLEAEVTSCRKQLLHPPGPTPSADPPSTPPAEASPQRSSESTLSPVHAMQERLHAAETAHAAQYAALRRQCLASSATSAQRAHEVQALKRRVETLQAMCSGYERTVNSLLGLSQPQVPAAAPHAVAPPATPPATNSGQNSIQEYTSASSIGAAPAVPEPTDVVFSHSSPSSSSDSVPASGGGPAAASTTAGGGGYTEGCEAPHTHHDEDIVHFIPSPEMVATFTVDGQRNRTAHRPPRPGPRGGAAGGGHHAAEVEDGDFSDDSASDGEAERGDEGRGWGRDSQSSDGGSSHSDLSDLYDESIEQNEETDDFTAGCADDDEEDDDTYWERLGVEGVRGGEGGLMLPARASATDPSDEIAAHTNGTAVRAAVQRIQDAGASPDGPPRRRSPLATSSPESSGRTSDESESSDESSALIDGELMFHHGSGGEGGAHSGSFTSSQNTGDVSLESDDVFAYEREALQGYNPPSPPAPPTPEGPGVRPQLQLPGGEGGGVVPPPNALLSDSSWSPHYSPVTPEGSSARSGYSTALFQPALLPAAAPMGVQGGGGGGAASPPAASPSSGTLRSPAAGGGGGPSTAPAISGIPRRRGGTQSSPSPKNVQGGARRVYVVPRPVELRGEGASMRLQAGGTQSG